MKPQQIIKQLPSWKPDVADNSYLFCILFLSLPNKQTYCEYFERIIRKHSAKETKKEKTPYKESPTESYEEASFHTAATLKVRRELPLSVVCLSQ